MEVIKKGTNKTIKLNDNYKVVVMNRDSNDNYPFSIHLFRIGEKFPLMGNSLIETSTIKDFKQWGFEAIARYSNHQFSL